MLEGRDLGELEQGEELSIQKARHHDRKQETGGEMPSSDSSASASQSYLKETEGHRSADTVIPTHSIVRERNKCYLCCVSLRDRFTTTWPSLDLGLCSGPGSYSRSVLVLFT